MSRPPPATALSAAAPVKATAVHLAPHASAASAFRQIMRSALGHLAWNIPAAITGVDDEGVHQARVAIRRLRTALDLFADYSGYAAAERFQAEFQKLARVLGEARDWDVFLGETAPAYRADFPDAPIGTVVAVARRRRRVAHRRLRAALSSPHTQSLLAAFEAWFMGDDWRAGLGRQSCREIDGPARAIAGDLLDRAFRRAERRGRGLARHTDEARHELRKMMKRLRYSAESLSGLYPRREVRSFLGAVEMVQDVLGRMNDVAVMRSLFGRLAASPGLDPAELAGFEAWVARGDIDRIDRLAAAWREFTDSRPFWR